MADKAGRTEEDRVFVNRALEAAIRMGLIALLAGLCLLIVRAFISPHGIIGLFVGPVFLAICGDARGDRLPCPAGRDVPSADLMRTCMA